MRDREKAEQIVYISCVEKIQYSFVSHLSDALRQIQYIDVFVDSGDLRSEEAQEKVKRARFFVMVLPGNLEPTTACQDKIVKVLDCQKNDDQVVVPVLYGIGTKLEEGKWHSVLQEMGGLSQGHQSRQDCTDYELVEDIVRDVYEKLFNMERIGIYSKLMEIKNMVCKPPLIRFVGIWGMPGIGKTTLAKAVYDQISGQFDAYCFIKDYDKAIREKGLNRLLEEQFLKEKPAAGGAIPKSSLLRNKLNNKRVLVVLDDVRNPLLAESFLGRCNWFGPKTLIIITSRDKQVFRLCRVNQIYEVQGLNEKEALQLFSLRASINDMAEQDRNKLSLEVIKYANGNPLALDVYGRELKGKKKPSEMETAFLDIKQRPPSEIVDTFKSSYDTLNDNEKNIFLDIACFFQGETVDHVMQLLEGCGFFPHIAIDVLVEKCLVTVSENRVWMHNMIQDFGRQIINGETEQIEWRSRLWEPSSIEYLLEDNEQKANAQGTEEIKGMFLDASNLNFDVKPTAFENMLNLRLLRIYRSDPEAHPVNNIPKGSLHSLPNELRLLHWENYPLQSLPPSFDPMHLVEINMPYSQLHTLWDGTKNLETLRTIRLCHSQQLVDIGDLSKAKNLEVVDLQGCTKLQSFPATCKLLHLRVVNLSGCTKIKTFPEVSPNIEALHLQGTGIIELSVVNPDCRELLDVSKLQGLSDVLILKRVTSLMKSSSSRQNLGKFICLDLKDCSHLQSLPDMVDLEFLKVLDISGCSELKTIKGLPRNLKELHLAVTAVRELPQLPQSLELLNAHGCVSLEGILLDSVKIPMHYTFSNCFNLSPQVVNVFLVKALANVKGMAKDCHQEHHKALPFSFCAPSQANINATFDLQPGSSVMTQLNPSSRSTLMGLAMLVEVAFPEVNCDVTGFSISCVCRWKNKEGRSYRIERDLLCWAPGKAVQKDHMFAFCDVNMIPSANEGNEPDICADLVVFEFFLVDNQKKPLDDSYTVKRCGVSAIVATTGNTSLESISPDLSLVPMEVYVNKVEVLRVRYDGLQEIDKVLFLYIACLFNDEDFGLVAPLIASVDLNVSSGLKVLANRSLISVLSSGEIVMPCLLRKMGKEILHAKSMLTGSSKELTHPKEKKTEIIRSGNLVQPKGKDGQSFQTLVQGSQTNDELSRNSMNKETKLRIGDVGGAGAVRVIVEAIVEAMREWELKSVSKELAWTMEKLLMVIKQIDSVEDVEELKDLEVTIDRAHVLVKKCSGVSWWNIVSKSYYVRKIGIINKRMLKFCDIDLLVIRFKKLLQSNDELVFRNLCSVPELGKALIGFDCALLELKWKLLNDSVGNLLVTAPPGCGKTTLVTQLCHDKDIKEKFKHVFFSVVSSTPNFRKLVHDLLQHNGYQAPTTFENDSQAIVVLEKLLEKLRETGPILLVLDDVWHGAKSLLKNFQNIIPVIPDFKILVTSRSHFLAFNVTFDLKPLEGRYAKNLLIKSASPPDEASQAEYEDLLQKILKRCNGIPLVIEVVGSSLKGQPLYVWKERLESWSQGETILGNATVLECLHPSFNALKPHLKECFMDMGSFLEDQKICASVIIDIWVELYGEGSRSSSAVCMKYLNDLASRNLLKLIPLGRKEPEDGFYNEFLVTQHDILRELAIRQNELERQRVNLEIREDNVPNRKRLLSISTDDWFSPNCVEMECPNVEALIVNIVSSNYELPSFISTMKKLKVVTIINHGFSPARLINLSCLSSLPNLKRIRLENVSITFLDILQLQLSSLKKLSLVWCSFGDVSHDTKEIVDVSKALPSLQEIDIDYCYDLVELPFWFSEVVSLKTLSITNCNKLSKLPEDIGNLSKLEVLRLISCINLSELPERTWELNNLRFLDISECLELKKLPLQIGKLEKLKKISMSKYSKCELPDSVTNLKYHYW